MNGEPLVSVVIATYNMGKYLPRAVKSILDQNWTNLEIVVIDDGSEDNTSERMTRFASDTRVKFLRTENRGQPKAKNLGITESTGEFIAFCDADDLWQPTKLRVQMPFFENPSVGVVYSEVSYIDEFGNDIPKPRPYYRHSGKITKHLVIKNFIPFGTAIVRKACIEKNGIFDESLKMGIDWDLWLRYSLDWQFQYVAEQTYIYRIWPGQMSNNYRGRYENAIRILEKFLRENPNVLSDSQVAKAWADMYVSRGMAIACAERTVAEPLKNIMLSLRLDISYVPAWRSLLKLVLRRV